MRKHMGAALRQHSTDVDTQGGVRCRPEKCDNARATTHSRTPCSCSRSCKIEYSGSCVSVRRLATQLRRTEICEDLVHRLSVGWRCERNHTGYIYSLMRAAQLMFRTSSEQKKLKATFWMD